jgi:hypothetical protein
VSNSLFRPAARFQGLPASGFAAFDVRDRDARRQAIIDAFHPALKLLGEDLVEDLGEPALHPPLPRLGWPKGYQPFFTWLALSRQAHALPGSRAAQRRRAPRPRGLRLGWDASADSFGRFEFLSRTPTWARRWPRWRPRRGFLFRVYAAALLA